MKAKNTVRSLLRCWVWNAAKPRRQFREPVGFLAEEWQHCANIRERRMLAN